MKPVEICVVTFLVFVNGITSLPISIPSYEIRDKLLSTHRKCMEKSSIDESVIKAVRDGVFSDDLNFKNYVLCSSQENGIRDENGVLNKNLLKEKTIRFIGDEKVANELFEKCVQQKETPTEEAFASFRCFYENSPKHATLYKDLFAIAESRQQLDNYHNECLTKSSVDRKILKNASKRGEFVEDPNFKSYLLCLSQKMGFINSNGDFESNEKIRQTIRENVEESELAETIVKNCFVKKDNPENTAFFVYKCYYDNTPIHIKVLPSKMDDKGKRGDKFKDCLTESGVDEQLVEKKRKGEFIDDPKLKNYMYCVSKKIGFQNSTGHIQKQVVMDKLRHSIKDEAVVQKLIDLCAIDRTKPEDSTFYTAKCFQENSPSELNIFKPPRDRDDKKKIKSAIKDCSVQTKVSKKAVLSARNGEFSDEAQLKDYLYCISRKAGIQNERGEINKDVVRNKLTGRFSSAETDKLMEVCIVENGSPQNTAFEAFRCFYKEAPQQICTFY